MMRSKAGTTTQNSIRVGLAVHALMRKLLEFMFILHLVLQKDIIITFKTSHTLFDVHSFTSSYI